MLEKAAIFNLFKQFFPIMKSIEILCQKTVVHNFDKHKSKRLVATAVGHSLKHVFSLSLSKGKVFYTVITSVSEI